MSKTLYIIDGYNLIFRMFYAVPEFRTRDGRIVNAVFGVAKGLLQILREDKPTHMVAAFDVSSDTFRKELYEDYKSNRDKMPDSLADQIESIMEVFRLLDIPQIGIPGQEADDIVGSFTNHPQIDEFDRVLIISSDKDLFQFIDEKKFRVYDMMKKRIYSRKEAVEKFGVAPEYIVDYLALVGDSSDMIPGVAGIGPKGAAKLINEYGSVEKIYEHIDEIAGSTQTKLKEAERMAFLSKQLATINVDIDLSQLTAQQMECHGTYEDHFTPEFLEFLEKNEFSSLIPKGMENGVEEELEFEELAVDDDKKLEKVLDLLRAKTSLTLRTVGTRTVLGKLFLAFDTTTVYEIDARNADYLRKIIELLLERKDHIRVVGYNLKMDLRRMQFFLDKTGVLADEEVQSLF